MWAITKTTYARHGIPGFYSGVGALVAGNSLKAGVRFLSYDSFKQMLVDKDVRLSSALFFDQEREIWLTTLVTQGKLSGPRSLLGKTIRTAYERGRQITDTSCTQLDSAQA